MEASLQVETGPGVVKGWRASRSKVRGGPALSGGTSSRGINSSGKDGHPEVKAKAGEFSPQIVFMAY